MDWCGPSSAQRCRRPVDRTDTLSRIYGPKSLGRLLSFLFIWQLSFSAPLSVASGCIGLSHYAGYLWPGLDRTILTHTFHIALPLIGTMEASILVMPATWVAIATCALVVILLYRQITVVGRLAQFLWVGVAIAVGWVIFTGLTHFSAARAFDFPPGAFTLSPAFFMGLGASMLIATYDYWGYYNVCFLGGEVKDPGKTIPRAIIISIVVVAAIYIVMNISALGVMSWRELAAHAADQNNYVIATVMQRIYGSWAGRAVAALIMWTAFASVFSCCWGTRAYRTQRRLMATTSVPSPASTRNGVSQRYRCWHWAAWLCCSASSVWPT